jgi:hypothetical protein
MSRADDRDRVAPPTLSVVMAPAMPSAARESASWVSSICWS